MADQFITTIQKYNPSLVGLRPEQIRQKILENVSNLSLRGQQYTVGPSAPVDVDAFGRLVAHAVRQQQIHDGVDNFIEVSEAFPSTDVDKEVITYQLKKRQPGTYSQDPPFSGVKNYKPLFRESYQDPDNPGYVVMVLGLMFDNIMELRCWAKTNREADRLALWLEGVMLSNIWMFRSSGINQIVYWGRNEDIFYDVNNIRLMGRTLHYYLRTEKLFTISEKTIDEILFATSFNLD
jgi:hypothetical protein